ncbi:hypothetical protein X566_22790 [Afipia sp. P52-10]|nr:hypothetical protein X566_22790 [Afipia sp. P52-10]
MFDARWSNGLLALSIVADAAQSVIAVLAAGCCSMDRLCVGLVGSIMALGWWISARRILLGQYPLV